MRRITFQLIVAFAAGLLVSSPATAQTRVACVGDSITEGANLSTTYPQALQQLLGSGYDVRNFGKGGTTLQNDASFPYTTHWQYTESLAFNPEIVVIMLGTNDGTAANWANESNNPEEFLADYASLLQSYKALSSDPTIFVCTPTPVYNSNYFGIEPAYVNGEIAPLIRDNVAQFGDVDGVIDLNALMTGDGAHFPDHVHPDEAGAAILAGHVHEVIVPEPTTMLLFGTSALAMLVRRRR
jgi:lysophospholipase L1-like esterase